MPSKGPNGVSGQLGTVRGTVFAEWQRAAVNASAATSTLDITLPVGVGGSIRVPRLGLAAAHFVVTEGGRPVWAKEAFVPGVAGVVAAESDELYVTFEVLSGRYTFLSAIA